MDFEFRYRVTYADGTVFKSEGYGLITISKETYKLIIKNAIEGVPIAEMKGISAVLEKMKDHATFMANWRNFPPSVQKQPVSKIEFFLPEGDLERFKKYSDPYEVIDAPPGGMHIYRSDGSCVGISCENGLVRVYDYRGEDENFRLYDVDEFASLIMGDRDESRRNDE